MTKDGGATRLAHSDVFSQIIRDQHFKFARCFARSSFSDSSLEKLLIEIPDCFF